MPHSSKETLAVGWCDNGLTDGKFTAGLVYSILQSEVPISNAVRVQGNQIGRQRQVLFDMWADGIKSDWLLWVDSDIVLTKDIIKTLWDAADKISRPVMCGVYFISKENEQSNMQPMPAIFNEIDEHHIQYIHPLPANEIVKIDCAGLGLTMMHKSVIEKLRTFKPDYSLFAEQEGLGDKFVSEDIVFFRNLKAAGIPVHAHTGARVQHMKRFSLDENYYKLYWSYAAMVEKLNESAGEQQA
jgi:GT2 family glycosyltransferase